MMISKIEDIFELLDKPFILIIFSNKKYELDLPIPVAFVKPNVDICRKFNFVRIPRYEFWKKGNLIKVFVGKRTEWELKEYLKTKQ